RRRIARVHAAAHCARAKGPSGEVNAIDMANQRPAKKRGQWRAILEGELREKAMASVGAIAAELEQLAPPPTLPTRIAIHHAWHALLHGYLGFAQLGERHLERSTQCLNDAVDAVAERPTLPWLYRGSVGVAWVLEHLQNHELNSVQERDEDVD